MQVSVKDMTGAEVEKITLNKDVFGVPMNKDVVYQALMWQRANSHLGTVDTKTRSEVSGSTRKPWRQKGTGRARAGTIRSPLWRHGGIVFGPHQRSFKQALNKKMRRLAIRCLLSDKQSAGELTIINNISIKEGKTREVAQALSALDMQDTVLVVMHNPAQEFVRAARNIEGVRTLPATQLNAADLLDYRHVIMTVEAVRQAEGILSREVKRGGSPFPQMAPRIPAPAMESKPKAAAQAPAKAKAPAAKHPAAPAAAKHTPAKAPAPKAEAPKAVEHKPKAAPAKAHAAEAKPKTEHKAADHKAAEHKTEQKAEHKKAPAADKAKKPAGKKKAE